MGQMDSDVCDGFGNSWERCSRGCTLHVVSPGRVQCNCEEVDETITVTQTPKMVRRMAHRFDPGGQVVEADICGRLPSGEHCCMDPDHEGPHYTLLITKVPTEYQGEAS